MNKEPTTDELIHRLGGIVSTNTETDLVFTESANRLRELQAENESLREQAEIFRDSVLNERHQLAEENIGNDGINAVLGLFDDTIGEALSKDGA